jgi:hypothetical protein
MGKRTRKNKSWHLEKETKGCWQEEKEERILGLLSQFLVLRKSYSRTTTRFQKEIVRIDEYAETLYFQIRREQGDSAKVD